MKKKIKNKFIFILAILSFAWTYDIYWEPINPNAGDIVEFFVDVSKDNKLKNSFPIYIHFKIDNNINSYPMSLNYIKGPSIWSYSTIYNESMAFAINNEYLSDNIDFEIIENFEISKEKESIYSDDFYEALLLISNKDYSSGFLMLEDIIANNQGKEISAEAEYIYAEIYLNDFEEYQIATDYYNNIINSYPKSFNVVKKSMFTLAYVYANHLHYYTDAINIYKNFQKEYPDDELNISIDYELEGLYKHDEVIQSLLNSSK